MADVNIDPQIMHEKSHFAGSKMSKSSAGSQVSPKNKNVSRRSAGSHDSGENARRASSGSSYSVKTRPPLHLRASTSSCHDLCKHGKRHSSEEEERMPLHDRIAKPLWKTKLMKSSDTKSSPIECKATSGDKIASSSRQTSSRNPSAKRDESVSSRAIIKREILLPPKEIEAPVQGGKSADIMLSSPVKLRRIKVKPRAPLGRKGSSSSGVITATKMTSAQKGRRKSDDLTARKTTVSPISSQCATDASPKESFVKTTSTKPGKHMSSANLKGQNKVTRVETGTPNSEVPEKILHVIEESHPKAYLFSREKEGDIKGSGNVAADANEFASEVKPAKCGGNEVDEFDSEKTMEMNMVQSEKEIRHKIRRMGKEDKALESVSNNCSTALSSPLLNNQKAKEFISEKIVVAENHKAQAMKIKHNQAIPNLRSRPSSSMTFASTESSSLPSRKEDAEAKNRMDGTAPENALPKNLVRTPSLKGNRNKILIKGRVVLSEANKPSSPAKLKFRQGTPFILPPADHNVPKKAKFRRPTLIDTKGDDSTCKQKKLGKSIDAQPIEKKKQALRASRNQNNLEADTVSTRRLGSSKMARSGDNKKGELTRRPSFKSSGAEISSLKTRLKHQSVQMKKTTRVLLNNVIEETASKLVQTRKSKVKALVGAFETVIQGLRPRTE